MTLEELKAEKLEERKRIKAETDSARESIAQMKDNAAYFRKLGDKRQMSMAETAAVGYAGKVKRLKKKLSAVEGGISRLGIKKKLPVKKNKSAAAFFGTLSGSGAKSKPTLQHVTSDREFSADIESVKSWHTDADGNLNKEEYCKSLYEIRSSLLVSIGEFEAAIVTARKEGNPGAVGSYEKMIEMYKSHCRMLENEIRSNGGKID